MSSQAAGQRMIMLPVSPMQMEPVTLDGQYVRLEPLSMDHYSDLCDVLLDEEIGRWLPYSIATPDDMRQFIEMAVKLQAEGSSFSFAMVYKPANRVVGTSRYLNIDEESFNLEIGGSLIGKQWQRTIVNTEAKYLMLRHAFETLGCIRVQFKTDSFNMKSRTALARIGAKEEGIIRNHMVCSNGRVRHSILFSITDEDWPTVKANLEAKLARPFEGK
jgi:RimJ/RimL family protein N-acetyltransferase